MNQPLELSAYHSFLRVTVVVLAAVLVFDSGLFTSATAQLSGQTQQYLANAVGVYAGVAPNEVNTLTTRITELEQQLSQREREIDPGLGGLGTASNASTFILSGILFIFLVLIILNYALDYARARERYVEANKTESLA